MKNSLTAAAALAILLAPPLSAEQPVAVLRAQVEELKGDLDRPLDELNQRYEAQLLSLKEQAQKSGDLDLALAASDELTSYKSGPTTPATDPKLKRLQEIYASETARLKKASAEKNIELLKGYRARLDAATTELTKVGDLDGALTYREETVKVDAEIASLNSLVATAAPSPAKPETPKPADPKEDDKPEFKPGVYQMGEGFGPTMIFHEDGKYDAKFFGAGKWKAKEPGKMVLNASDEFSYVPGRDIWLGTIDFGGEREVVLKFVGGNEGEKEGKKENKEESSKEGDRRPSFGPGGGGSRGFRGDRSDRD